MTMGLVSPLLLPIVVLLCGDFPYPVVGFATPRIHSSGLHYQRRCNDNSGNVVCQATVAPPSTPLVSSILESMQEYEAAGQQWTEMFGLQDVEGRFFSLFSAIRKHNPLGLRGEPFVIRKEEFGDVAGDGFGGFFTFDDLAQALQDDFLDAGRGSTDNRKGWKVRANRCTIGRDETSECIANQNNNTVQIGTRAFCRPFRVCGSRSLSRSLSLSLCVCERERSRERT